MKKIILPVALVAATGAGIVVGVNQPKPDKDFSDLVAENIEAVSEKEAIVIVKYARGCVSHENVDCCTGPYNFYPNSLDVDDLEPNPFN